MVTMAPFGRWHIGDDPHTRKPVVSMVSDPICTSVSWSDSPVAAVGSGQLEVFCPVL